jgi:hypothetical protein
VNVLAYCALAAIQGVMVALPRGSRSCSWERLRSPGWALILPVSLIVGTFGVLGIPGFARALALAAAATTPVFAGLAIGIVRGPRTVWLAALPALGVGVATLSSWPAALAATAVTALGCVMVGAALVRLTPLRWLAAGIAAMCAVDVVLLATGVGQPAATILQDALTNSGLPEFHHARIGPITTDYPDFVLTAVFGNVVAGSARQHVAAVLVAVLVAANGLLLVVADMLPATVPIGVAGAVLLALERGVRWRTLARVAVLPALALCSLPLYAGGHASSSEMLSRPYGAALDPVAQPGQPAALRLGAWSHARMPAWRSAASSPRTSSRARSHVSSTARSSGLRSSSRWRPIRRSRG